MDEINLDSDHCTKAGVAHGRGDNKLKHWRGTQGIVGCGTAPVLEFIFFIEPVRRHTTGDENNLRKANSIAFTALD